MFVFFDDITRKPRRFLERTTKWKQLNWNDDGRIRKSFELAKRVLPWEESQLAPTSAPDVVFPRKTRLPRASHCNEHEDWMRMDHVILQSSDVNRSNSRCCVEIADLKEAKWESRKSSTTSSTIDRAWKKREICSRTFHLSGWKLEAVLGRSVSSATFRTIADQARLCTE